MADDDMILQDDTNETEDDDLLLSEVREAGSQQNDLIDAEKEAISNEEFDEPSPVGKDPGIVDEANMDAELWQEGTGTDVDEEDMGDLGFHVEQAEFIADTDEEGMEDLDDFSNLNQPDDNSK